MCQCQQYHSPSDETPVETIIASATRSWKCRACGHFPARHERLGARNFRGCYQPVDSDHCADENKHFYAERDDSQDHDKELMTPSVLQDVNVLMQVQDIECALQDSDVLSVPLYAPHLQG